MVEEIAAEVLRREPVNGIRIVGVDGPGGAGKSVLATALAQRLAAPVIEVDDFVSWDDLSGWWPRFDAQVLAPLLAGQDATYQVRDWATDWHGSSLAGWKTLPWAPTVIVEGVTCTRRETVGRIVYATWVHAPADLRLARGLARDAGLDGAEALWRRSMSQQDAFFTTDGTRERADRIVDTSARGGAR